MKTKFQINVNPEWNNSHEKGESEYKSKICITNICDGREKERENERGRERERERERERKKEKCGGRGRRMSKKKIDRQID